MDQSKGVYLGNGRDGVEKYPFRLTKGISLEKEVLIAVVLWTVSCISGA